ELNCETDFVARNEEFLHVAKDIAMHIAASSPKWVKPDDVPADVIEHEKSIYMEEARQSGKPEQVLAKIAEGKLNKFYEDNCLLHQKFVKDQEKTINDLVADLLAKMGEKIEISRFIRFKVGEVG
ncbi:MAG: translation elongation factor Ts, partial [Deltaproteobacteria bacterium]|nr:translation elongation factor Ts [Deltaproteobacteria bacterium]